MVLCFHRHSCVVRSILKNRFFASPGTIDFLSLTQGANWQAFRPAWPIFANGLGCATARQQAGSLVLPAGRDLLHSLNI